MKVKYFISYNIEISTKQMTQPGLGIVWRKNITPYKIVKSHTPLKSKKNQNKH